ncbi:hypothetical protein PG993_011035 [Apiospora rasikravindrae]|uniref:Uncharacterized protein n=1 Tax=Apiospora rasikravindrae TaxID=990691 RepID=A0ABR1SEU0_9PEZI
MSSPTFISARQKWKRHCEAMEEKYRKARSKLDTLKNNELSALSAGGALRMTDDQRRLAMDKVTADYAKSMAELEARRRREAQDYLRSLTYSDPQEDQQQPPTSHTRASVDPKDGGEAKAMDTQRSGAVHAETGPRRWELHGNTVRSIPLHSPSSDSSTHDQEILGSKRKADGDNNPYPKRQRVTESAFVTPGMDTPDPIKTLMFADVRKNAVDRNDWDTIIEWPEQSKQFWVLFCEEHRIHFKQKADNAAAKHLAGSLHGLPTRDRRPALVQLGYYIPDCTDQDRESHNAEVNAKYAAGYIPRNEHKREARVKDLPAPAPDRSPQKPNQAAANSATSIITHPKTGHVYYAKYEGQHWAVVILGWDKLPEGCRHPTLAASELIKHDPPRCYHFEGYQRILGWKPNYVDGGKSVEKREFPVMYFDTDLNYGWVPAKDLSKLDLDRANAPKRKGYPEISYNQARDWVAERWGSKSWEKLSADRKGLRVRDSADPQPKPPDIIRPAGPQYRAPQSRDNSECSFSNLGDKLSEPERGTNPAEKENTPKTNNTPMHILSFDETLERLSSNPDAFQNSLISDIKGRDKPNSHPVSSARTANSTPGMTANPAQEPAINTARNAAPQAAARPASAAAVLAAPVLAPPVIIPPVSAPSPQMPTPQTPTPQTQVATIGGNQGPLAGIFEISSYERLISEGGEIRSQLIWQRGSRDQPCVRLVISADRRTAQAQGGPFELTINPLECERVRLKTVFEDGLISEHGIGYVTLPLVSGEPAIKMTFDRSDDENGDMGHKRMRRFSRWLWEINPNMKS